MRGRKSPNWRKGEKQLHSRTQWTYARFVNEKERVHVLTISIMCTILHFQWKFLPQSVMEGKFPGYRPFVLPTHNTVSWGTWLLLTPIHPPIVKDFFLKKRVFWTPFLMRWCCWCATAADAVDALMLLIQLNSWCADAPDALMLLMCCCCWCCWCCWYCWCWWFWCVKCGSRIIIHDRNFTWLPKMVSLPRLRKPRGPNLEKTILFLVFFFISHITPFFLRDRLQKAFPPVIDCDQHHILGHQIVRSINSTCTRPWEREDSHLF